MEVGVGAAQLREVLVILLREAAQQRQDVCLDVRRGRSANAEGFVVEVVEEIFTAQCLLVQVDHRLVGGAQTAVADENEELQERLRVTARERTHLVGGQRGVGEFGLDGGNDVVVHGGDQNAVGVVVLDERGTGGERGDQTVHQIDIVGDKLGLRRVEEREKVSQNAGLEQVLSGQLQVLHELQHSQLGVISACVTHLVVHQRRRLHNA